MHIEILVEDISGKTALEHLVPKILGNQHSYRIHPYKGIGRIPQGLKHTSDPNRRILLSNLPRILQGYGKTQAGYKVIVICDLDDKNYDSFTNQLKAVLDGCAPKPDARFCLAVEEGEAWFLGDIPAVKAAYRHADDRVLSSYVNDSICGTWEKLADAIYKGGAKSLKKQGWQAIGVEKTRWAQNLSPRMDVDRNASPSFCRFRDELRSLDATRSVSRKR